MPGFCEKKSSENMILTAQNLPRADVMGMG